MSVEAIDFQHEDQEVENPNLDGFEDEDSDHRFDRKESSASYDLVRVYLNGIGKVALLNAAEEVELAKKIEAGLYAEKVLEATMLQEPIETKKGIIEPIGRMTRSKRQDYHAVIHEGDQARRKMLEANQRLVVSLAKRYTGKGGSGMPLLDLIQEGNLGLIRAVEKFDYTKGFKFSTYATWWIRQSISRGIGDQARTVRLPIHIVEKINKLHRLQREINNDFSHEATLEDLADEAGMTPEKVEEVLALAKDPVSFSTPAGDMDDGELGDFIAVAGEENPVEECIEFQAMQKDLTVFLRQKLTDREYYVINLRFGLDNGNPLTLDQIGQHVDLSRERVRQIERDAMKKLAVIDGKSVFYRGYYAMSGLSLRDGTPTGGVFGFASMAIELIKKLEPDYVVVAWDKPKTNIRKRLEIYPAYKAGRKPAPPDFYDQIPLLMELLEAFHWPMYEIDDYEADDIMGTFALQAEKKGYETDLITSDLDALQLIGHKTKVFALKTGFSNIEEYDVEYFEKKHGISVDQFLDLKSLKGDSSDNIPGVPGVGEKTATELLREFKTLDGIYEHLDDIKPSVSAKLRAGKESAYMSKEIGRIWTDAPVEVDWDEADVKKTDLSKVAAILDKFEFHSLTKRLPEHMQDQNYSHTLAVNKLSTEDLIEKPWPKELMMNGPVIMDFVDGEVWLSPDRETVYRTKMEDVDKSTWRALEMGTVVAYDVKQMYHDLAAAGVKDIHFATIHDIRQAAFLIDPLRRDRALGSLVGGQLETQLENIAALWQVYDWQIESFKVLPRVAEIAQKFDFPLIYTLFLIEHRGIKIDKKLLATMSKELGEEHAKLEQQMYTMAGNEFNIGSPAQLSEVLFTKLQLSTAGVKKGKTGYSTDQKTLDKLRGLHPIIELIERTRELAKLKNTYVDTLPLVADKHDRIHTTFNQDVAATGRLSSTDPNLQNIPVRTDLGRRIREAFIPEKGNVLVGADYSQFELRLAAVLADDKGLIEDFNNDVDIHTKTAAQANGVPMEDVTKTQRRDAKVINFGVLYGMSPHGLSVATGMSVLDAKKYIDQYFEMRAPIRKYIDATLEKAKIEGYVETFHGRRRPTPDVNSSNFIVREAARRQAANMPIQGTEADLMKLAMLQIENEIGDLGKQILQVHDSVLVECPKDNAEKVGNLLKSIMENIAPELPVKLKVDVNSGDNWGEL